ncbi:MAG TPA: class I SAM-dependent methyltransferase [Solirubrobacteraceae bacterium]|nr:class I SAM-dependent methyltransferase [Solirubrobacteraceae bacterium]
MATKEDVRTFWEADPCGAARAEATEGTPEFFAQVAAARDELEPFIADYADFASTRGQSVLEIGVGVGSDFIRFARAGARATGVDLTEHAIALVGRRLELEGLSADLRQADAERLPFADGTFDVVYSWGVLHHTPDCERAIAEAQRVLKPGGRLCVMLYARHSWLAYALWVRHALLKGRPTRSLADVISEHMESAGTRAFTRSELRRRFAGLEELTVEHVGTPYDRRAAGPLAAATGRWLGWFLVVRGRAPG